MELWKSSALSLIIFGFFCAFATNKHCEWVLEVVQKENLSQVAPVIIPGGQYFLRIRVKCDDKIHSQVLRSLVLTGVNPVLNIESEAFGINHHGTRRFSVLISAVLTELGDQLSCGCLSRKKTNRIGSSSECFCSGIKPLCKEPDDIQMEQAGVECCQTAKNCSNVLELCNPAWFVPLHIADSTNALHCEVVDSGIGPYINSQRLTLHLDAFHFPINNTIQNRLGDEETQLPSLSKEIAVSCLPNLSPICLIGSDEMTNHVIYTSSEFEKMQFLRIQLEKSFGRKCILRQTMPTVQVKGAITLPDRILLNTDAGIFEMQGNGFKSKDYDHVLSACVRHLVGPAQSTPHTVTVLAFGDEQDQEKIFVAVPERGKPCSFEEQRDSNGHNACQFLRSLLENTGSYPCQVISGSVSGVDAGTFVVLVKLETPFTSTFHLIQFQGHLPGSGQWIALFHFPSALDHEGTENVEWQKIESEFSVEAKSGTWSLLLHGLTFMTVACHSLFVWGNALLYSPYGGHSIHWLTNFPGNSSIMVFTSSPFDGKFAFLTDDQQVWIGQSGSSKLQRLKSSMGPKGLSPELFNHNEAFILSIFFDSSGLLQQVIVEEDSTGETKCISREEIPVASIISRQLYTQKQQENLKSNKKARANSASCIQDQSVEHKQYIGESACPFTRIAFEANHDVLYTRKCFYKFEPSVRWDGGLIQGRDALHDYYTRVSRTMNSECAGISTDTRQSMRDHLPLLIYLGRSERYSFVFYLYLDSDIQEDTSEYAWSLVHLQASLHVSDTMFCNLTSQRTELIPQKAVKYEVTLQDNGLRLPQQHSGEGLTPTSLHIQVWNSALTCSSSYGRKGFLEGSYLVTVLLGCPAGLKLAFDPDASKNATGKEHFCTPVDGVPCFYFYRDFLPVFKLIDLATGQISQFHGNYRLTIVGGGPTYQSITDYTEEEQIKYNYQTTSSMAFLIWASKLKTLGDIPVFNSKTNGISWLCGTQSPCADVGPNFPGNAEYYFKLEFSNRLVDADSSNCDFTVRFVIRVHGLPPGSFNPSSVIVLSCIGILASLILMFFALTRQDARLWDQLKNLFTKRIFGTCREKIYNIRNKSKINPLGDQLRLQTVGRDPGGADVSVEIKGSTTAAQVSETIL
ncbi:unnamed protein product [Porites lobata]|uniref:Uncharacterized protein n=1 Tax=Porites lobata TaxID=104759 RepID=A0ABN8NKR1_9CNID|nr:unnamed protein product [Porites lobata]